VVLTTLLPAGAVGTFEMPADDNAKIENNRVRHAIFSILLLAVSLGLCLVAAEAFLRLKNSAMTNYDIEMWRYANELKQKSDDVALDFDHLRSKSAVLQNTEIRLNSWGLRGPEPVAVQAGLRRILFLGGSITLGWGVPEDRTVEADLLRMMAATDEKIEVLNAGVGNYNTERYVSRFFKELTGLKPTDIVVHYFLRDAEQLPPGGGNFLLRHSELAVTLWIAYHRLLDKHGETSLVEHYRKVYDPSAPGFQIMQSKLRQLADYAKRNNVRLYLAMVPDVHNLIDYKFAFVHDTMRRTAEADGYVYVDLLPAMLGHPPEQLWAMPGDPHPNALGHKLMADAIFPVLAGKSTATATTAVQN
jgi:lysophospholipase L1-like esterase